MLLSGEYYLLKINRVSAHGLYLVETQPQDHGDDNSSTEDVESEEVLLPNRYVSLDNKVGDTIEVFVYHDSENRLIATTEHPYASVNQVALLKAVDQNVHGAFLDWGITAKDLFVPNSNQQIRMTPGNSYVVYIYRDNITGRVVGTARLNSYVNNEQLSIEEKEQVEIFVAKRLDIGYRVVINNRHWGMIYDNQIFRPVEIGQRLTAYVRRINEDNRIDISLQQEGFDEVRNSARRLYEMILRSGGHIDLNDKSTPEQVSAITQMSKKVFRRALGFLLSHSAVELDPNGGISVKKHQSEEK